MSAAAVQTVSALPTPVDLEVYAGDDFYLDLIVANPDGTDADLSGAVPAAQIRAAPAAASVLATFTATVEGNVVHLHLPGSESAKLSGPLMFWDAQITNAGDVTTLAAGQVRVTAEVTRP